MSGIVNKIKEAVHPHHDKDNRGAPEGTHGPHNSRVANAADPRVDSDRDHSTTVGTGRTAGHGEYGSSGYGIGTAEGVHGPHSSRVANAMDPRVDSDRDHSTTIGTGTTGYSTGTSEGAYGPHSSRLANAADPRVDSDRDNSATFGTGRTTGTGLGTSGFGSSTHHTTGAGSGVTGMTGTHGAPAGTHGPHNSRIANAADPRVDSDRDGRAAVGSAPGPAANTAGPHKSDVANKMDPRVDSDLDGSRTVGGNKTYQSGTTTSTYRDPTDAAQVPPSVLRQHVGAPSIEHDDSTHHRERRNSVQTHQERFSGI
ncbi:hypothetical protein C8A03DRAFT_44683 [Achaetomium macrosporum]|uniref:Uncharacterized protein n=1 Tax=Achaetomium macrosporum TaxID=79813 RepID=A0AAN7C9V7_9PEZI|nr:hypothetical protein C8A03DRAFT_44683 [Achaetomium macrosporum]